jgi:cyclopropane-fatty-acyl-phospholipid synthase
MSAGRRDATARRIVLGALERVTGGHLTLVEAGRTHHFGDGRPDRHGRPALAATVTVHDPRTYRRILGQRSPGLGESYADGWWDTDDLTALLRVLERNIRRADPALRPARRLTARVADPIRRRRPQSLNRDRTNVRAHYDLGNDFFERLLDETMMYSSAIFPSPSSSLAEASAHKLDRLCQRIALGPDDHVLEIGTGWGGFAVHAAEHVGCKVTTTTISARQHEYALERVRAAGLEDRVTVLDRDYRELGGTYDAVVSIEMIEAVDWREYETFFAACRDRLTPGGRLGMQAIVIPGQRFEQAKATRDFIKEVIFPGGCLPSIEALLQASSAASDLTLTGMEDIGLHYAETLRRWAANLDACRADLGELGLDDRFGRLWDFYLRYCEAGFEERDISAVQLVLSRPGSVPGGSGRSDATGRSDGSGQVEERARQMV